MNIRVSYYVHMMLEKIDLLCQSDKKSIFQMPVNMLVQLKSYHSEFLKVKLTHSDNVIGSRITPVCIRFNRTTTGLNNLYMIDNPCSVFDPEH